MLETFNLDELKEYDEKQLVELSQDIRDFLINNVSKTGGHLGSNLGVVELTIMLHKIFNSPKDKLIFDVGHQGYVHKILTGRKDQFSTLRQTDGLSGFLKRNESEHDVWEAGHSSTSLSAACGFALARDLNHQDHEVVCIIGDGSLTNGMSLEALNHLISLNTKVIIILNDNEMSISHNVGFIDNILKNIQISNSYDLAKVKVKQFLNHIPGGAKLSDKIAWFKEEIKYKISPCQSFFNLMGFDYIGPIDGHNFDDLEKALTFAKQTKHSIIVHVKTTKGKGYEPAQQQKWHGVNPFDVKTGLVLETKKGITNSKLVANTLEYELAQNNNIVVVTPAMASGSELTELAAHYPNNFTDVGIAEEHAVTFSAALALDGKIPFCCIYSTFLQRAYDQIFHDVVRQDAHVILGIDRAGIVGQDGETHQGIYDLTFLLPMPNLVIVEGSCQDDIISLIKWAITYPHPVAIRYARGGNYLEPIDYSINSIVPFKWKIKKSHPTTYVLSYGNQINELMNADLDCGIIDCLFLKPLDYECLDNIKKHHLIIVEEHVEFGGFNTYVKQYLPNTNIDVIALPNDFIKQGKVNEILEKYNLSGEPLINKVKEYINEEN